VRTVLEGNIVI